MRGEVNDGHSYRRAIPRPTSSQARPPSRPSSPERPKPIRSSDPIFLPGFSGRLAMAKPRNKSQAALQPPPPPHLLVLTEAQAARLLGLSKFTLHRMRTDPQTHGSGPKAIQLTARRIGYRRADLEAWLDTLPPPSRTPTGRSCRHERLENLRTGRLQSPRLAHQSGLLLQAASAACLRPQKASTRA